MRKYCHQTKRPSVRTLFVCIDFGRNDPGPKRLTSKIGRNDPPTKAETTHPKNWPKRPRPKRPGRNDPEPKRPGFLTSGSLHGSLSAIKKWCWMVKPQIQSWSYLVPPMIGFRAGHFFLFYHRSSVKYQVICSSLCFV